MMVVPMSRTHRRRSLHVHRIYDMTHMFHAPGVPEGARRCAFRGEVMAVTKRHRNARSAEAAAVTRRARANPDTLCCECGNTLDQCGPRGDGRNANGTLCTWDAGHPDGRWPTKELRAECSSCNRSRGAADGNRQREPHSEVW